MSRPLKHVCQSYIIGLLTFLLIGLIYFGRAGQAHTAKIPQDVQVAARPGEYYTSDNDLAPSRNIQQPVGDQDGIASVVIELDDEAAAQTFARTRSSATDVAAINSARQQINRIDGAQRRMLPALSALRADVIYRTQRVYNGIAVRVASTELDRLRQLPGVKAIHPLIPKERLTSTSVPFIGAPAVWKGNNLNLTGKNIKIGIIDSGIDYKHSDFGGTSSTTFPSAKVVGGFDFVGDAYTGSNTPLPDNDPMDCNGHGTHVAGIAAGFGVNADGSVYTGVYDQTTPFSTMKIGPGVAPEAKLYALRVFGCDGTTRVTDQAIEWAMDPNGDGDFSDHLDVINLSLGSDYGSAKDTTAVAADNASLAGVIVVAAAGNSGDSYYVTSSPAAATHALSVGASYDDGTTTPAIRVNSPSQIAGVYNEAPALFGPPLTETGISGDVVYAVPNNGCSTLTNSTSVSGKIVLIESDTCPFLDKARNAQTAGAIAMVVTRSFAGTIFTMGPADNSITIPSVMIDQTTGGLIKANLNSPGVNLSLGTTFGIPHPELSDLLAMFTSRGPRLGDSAMKPDLTAPGVAISSAKSGSGSGSITFSGTSMATPHVAGEMALLRQLHPTWTVDELKALAMNTALGNVSSVHTIPPGLQRYSPTFVGTGRIDLPTAALNTVVGFDADAPGQVGLSFGTPEVLNTLTLNKTLRLVNKGSAPVTYSVSYDPVLDMSGAEFVLPDGSSISIPAGGMADVPVQLLITAQFIQQQQFSSRNSFDEESGYIAFKTPGSSVQSFRVSVFAAPRRISEMEPSSNTIFFFNGPIWPIQFTNDHTNFGMIAVFELFANLPPNNATIGLNKSADVQYIGISNNYRGSGPLGSTQLQFGFSTYENWSSPNQLRLEVGIDTDRDGVDDFLLYNSNQSTVSSTGQPDHFQSQVFDVKQGKVIAQNDLNWTGPAPGNRVFNTNMMFLPSTVTDFGLTDGNSQFNFTVRSFYRGALVKKSQTFSYDATKPGLSFQVFGVASSSNTPSIPITYFPDNYRSLGIQGILTLGFSNPEGKHTSVVSISTDNPIPVINSYNDSNPILVGSFPSITINGNLFAPSAVAQWNGQNRPTTVFNSATLRVELNDSDTRTAVPGTLTVTNPSPGGGVSNSVVVPIVNPVPFINGLTPTSIEPGAGTSITVTGLRFVSTSIINLNGKPLATTFIDSTKLTAAPTVSDLAVAGDAKVTVTNPQPGGGTTSEKIITITKGVASLALSNLNQTYDGTPRRVSVTSTPSGLSGVSVTYNGSSSEPVDAGVYDVVATLNNNAFITATISGSLTIGKADQTVALPQISDRLIYDTPFQLNGSTTSGLTLTYEATGNVNISGNTVTITGAGPVMITASQAGNNNYNAAVPVSRTFNISNPSPQVLRLIPGAVIAGSNQTTIKIAGGNFVSDSLVNVDGINRPATFVNRIEMDLPLSAAELAAPGTKTITISNPSPGGGNSVPIILKVISIVTSDSKDIQPGTTDTVSNAPTQTGDAGITAQLNHSPSAAGPANISVQQYSADPLGGSGLIDVGGGYVDLKVTGAAAGDTLNTTFYYGSNVTGANEDKLQLLYFTGTKWAKVRSSGNTDAIKNTADNQDGTVSGGSFTVIFDETSSPKLSQLTGTIFSSTPGLYGDLNNDITINVSDLILMANFLAGNVTVDKTAGDLNQDNKLNVSDLLTLANYLAGNVAHLPLDKINQTASSPADLTAFGFVAPRAGLDSWYPSRRKTVAVR